MTVTILLSLVGTLNLLVGLMVLLRNPTKLANVSFFSLALSTAAWVFGIVGFLTADTSAYALSWARFYYIAPLVIASSSVVFAEVFPIPSQRLWVGRRWLLGIGLVCLSSAILIPDIGLLTDIVSHPWGRQVTLNMPIYMLYSLFLIICFCSTIATMYAKSKTSRGLAALQASMFLRGFVVSCVLGLFFNLILPAFGDYRWIWLGPLASSFYVFVTAYGIIRHRLFNIRLVVARAMGYVLTVAFLATVYGFVVFGIARTFFGLNISVAAQVWLAITTGVAGLLFQTVRKRFDRATNKVFYQDAYDPQELLYQLNHILVSNTDLNIAIKKTADLLLARLRPTYIVFGIRGEKRHDFRIIQAGTRLYVPDDFVSIDDMSQDIKRIVIVTDYLEEKHTALRKQLEDSGIAVVIKLTPKSTDAEENLGYIGLPTKKSGNPYTLQDLKIFDTIANELVIAIQNALQYEEIRHFNETLQENVAEATRKLRRSNEKLQALDATKDDFITMASHQLRTPLTSIKGYLSMVLEGDVGKLNNQQRQLLTQSYLSSQRMVYLISDLLNLSRLNTGKFVIDLSPVDLGEIVQSELDQLYETARAREVELVYTAPTGLPRLMLDETKIRQVVMNLIDNAIYYTPAGGQIRVEILVTKTAVEFRATDNGIGVPRAVQHRLFTKFYRAQNAVAARPDGTGLGLFMAKKVVVAQGGAIIFKSEEGKGSTFGFRFGIREHQVSSSK